MVKLESRDEENQVQYRSVSVKFKLTLQLRGRKCHWKGLNGQTQSTLHVHTRNRSSKPDLLGKFSALFLNIVTVCNADQLPLKLKIL